MAQDGFGGGPAALVLMASIARRYYVDGLSKVDIADEFGLSRFKVARLIESARTSGLVRIEIGHSGLIDVDLSGRLCDRFGLAHSLVIQTSGDDGVALRAQLGKLAADLLGEIVTSDDVLGVAWARSVRAMTASLTHLAATPAVQLTGALPGPLAEENSIELVRDVVRVSGGPAYVFYAPMILPDVATARVLREQAEVVRAFKQFPTVTKAVVGIGSWEPGLSTLFDAVGDRDRQQLSRKGVIGDISGVFIDATGAPVTSRLSDRMIAMDGEQMRRVPEVIGIAYGAAKSAAVRAALQGGLVNGLVVNADLARTLLDAN